VKRLIVASLSAAAITGCGSPSADLFAVNRSGSIAGARLQMVVSDGGTVRCNSAKPVKLTNDQLLDARELQRELKPAAERHLELPARPGSIMRYRVKTPDGTLRFADNSTGTRAALARMTLFTREVARQRCRLAR
jgi:hypothetical protein